MHGMYGSTRMAARAGGAKRNESVIKVSKRKLDHVHVYLENQNLWCSVGQKSLCPNTISRGLGRRRPLQD